MTVKTAPDRAWGKAGAMLLVQHLGNLGQRYIHLRLDGRENDGAISLDPPGAAVPALTLGGARPASAQARTQRIELDADTPNRTAAARRDSPPTTAAINRDSRPSDKDFASLLVQQTV
jgi:hypothetical protein